MRLGQKKRMLFTPPWKKQGENEKLASPQPWNFRQRSKMIEKMIQSVLFYGPYRQSELFPPSIGNFLKNGAVTQQHRDIQGDIESRLQRFLRARPDAVVRPVLHSNVDDVPAPEFSRYLPPPAPAFHEVKDRTDGALSACFKKRRENHEGNTIHYFLKHE